jgi:RND family efflux transporter MFP subunit
MDTSEAQLAKLLRAIPVAAALTLLASCGSEAPEPREVIRPIKIQTITGNAGGRSIAYAGRVEAGETADLGFEVRGRIVELAVIESQQVRRGELLARLDPADFQSNLDKAEADLRSARSTFDRFAELVERGAVSRQEFEDRKRNLDVAVAARDTARKALDDTRLLAPFDGMIGRTYVDNFVNVQAKQPVVLLQNLTKLDVVITVPEQDLANGGSARDATLEERSARINPQVSLSSLPGRSFPAVVTELSTLADPVTRTFEARVTMDNPPDASILPGMTANVTITVPAKLDGEAAAAVLLPATAVLADDDGNPTVWKVDPASMTVSRAPVTLGELGGNQVRVLSGLAAGDRVAVSGVHNLREGMTVRALGE